MRSTHQSKKQYNGSYAQQQPSIKSYFSVVQSCSITDHTSAKTTNLENRYSPPAVPEHIASDLLNVGMRVRKSIPEGYKTEPRYTIHTRRPAMTVTKSNRDILPISYTPVMKSNYTRQELAPFCGLNKTGGLAQQDVSPDEDDMPCLSSQASTITNVSVSDNPKGKRRFVEEDDDYLSDEDVVTTLAPLCQRSIMPTRSRATFAPKPANKPRDVVTISEFIVDDFEEAGFLVGQCSDEEVMDYE